MLPFRALNQALGTCLATWPEASPIVPPPATEPIAPHPRETRRIRRDLLGLDPVLNRHAIRQRLGWAQVWTKEERAS